METLRIAILTETLPPDSLKLQPWRYLGELARALQDAGHEASALTTEAGVPTWNGVRVDRHPDAIDFRSARRLHRLVETRGYDAGIVRLTAGLFFSLHREPGTPPSKGRLIGIFLRPLHSGWDLARRFLDPTLVPEIRLDLHHAGLYASRRLGTWADPPPYVNDYAFLWESDRATGISAGLPAGSCHVVRHPFDPFFLDRRGAGLGSRLSGAFGPVPRRVIFSGPPEATRGSRDVVQLPSVLPRDPPTQVVLLLRDGRFPAPVVKRKRIGVHEVLAVHGLITREELRAIYRTSHVAVFPYRFVRTGLPLVVLEAVAAGLPVVTTRIHPIRELEGRTGLVFARPRNPPDIARAIESAFDDAQRAAVVRKNDEWIRTTPDWFTVAKIFVSFVRR